MTEALTARWIEEQLEICGEATRGPWHIGARGGPSGPFHSLVTSAGQVVAMMIDSMPDAQLMAAAREGYPLALKEAQNLHASFALYSKATRAARELYRKAHPELGELTDPDTGKVMEWLVADIGRMSPYSDDVEEICI